MSSHDAVEPLLQRYVEHHVLHGERLAVEELCAGRPELIGPLRECVRRYEMLQATLDCPRTADDHVERSTELPVFEGFRTIERIGGGGGGEVFKLEDLQLGRTVAAKVVRRSGALSAGIDDFLREARSLALFEDPRIVRIFEFRRQSDPPVLLMEYVDGFELNRIAPSLEFSQRARVMIEICEAIQHAHELGLQHRDLKPANVLLDAKLAPKILDFGLSRGEPDRGHGVGTPAYMAPEQLDPGQPIDERSDIYALGVLFYEMLCGARPFDAAEPAALLSQMHAGAPRLPVEIEPDVPEPLQAIALRAMERQPQQRFASAREMAQDLRRYLQGKPVLARPTIYHSALGRRLQPHLEQIREWLRLKLIYPHEAQRLRDAYRGLEVREDDWIIQSRSLSISQISLYLGGFLLLCGGLLYFGAYVYDAVDGLLGPALVLGLPFAGLNFAARHLHLRQRKAVAVAFYLAAVALLPLFLLIALQEAGWWVADPDAENELLAWLDGPSNRQLQLASLVACAWAGMLAWSTRTLTLGTCFTALVVIFDLALLADFGLRLWLEHERWDLLSLHLVPLLVLAAGLGYLAEARRRPWFAGPLYMAAAGLFVLVLELLALNGKAFEYVGLSMAPFQGGEVSNPTLLDTLSAMTINGVLIYLAGRLLDKRGSELMQTPSWLLYSLSPFAILEPIAYLNAAEEYPIRYAWLYLSLSLLITWLSHFRQRKSFYYAGLVNTGIALWYITHLNQWWDRPWWSVAVLVVGLAVLAAGLGLHVRERRRRPLA